MQLVVTVLVHQALVWLPPPTPKVMLPHPAAAALWGPQAKRLMRPMSSSAAAQQPQRRMLLRRGKLMLLSRRACIQQARKRQVEQHALAQSQFHCSSRQRPALA